MTTTQYTSIRVSKTLAYKLEYTRKILKKLREQEKVTLEQAMDFALEYLLVNNKDVAEINEIIMYNVKKGRLLGGGGGGSSS